MAASTFELRPTDARASDLPGDQMFTVDGVYVTNEHFPGGKLIGWMDNDCWMPWQRESEQNTSFGPQFLRNLANWLETVTPANPTPTTQENN